MRRVLLTAEFSLPLSRVGHVARGCRAPVTRRAFTLLELLIALSLLVLLAAFAWPLMENQIGATAMPESAARMRDTLFLARAEAMQQHRRVRVRFAPNEQQPFLEIELDPMREPGKWEPISTNWVKELPLVDVVQVHTIESGRPAYLKPISFDTSADEAQEDSDEQEQQEDTEDFDATLPSSTSTNDDVELDDNRPIIYFEPDGASEWATIMLAKIPLEQELKEEDDQLWVILDGRTGLAYIREQVTEAQLADETFYIKRENLELPKQEGTEDLVLGAQDPNAASPDSTGGGAFGGQGGNFGQGGQNNGGFPGGSIGPGDLAGLPDDIRDRLPGGGGMGGGRDGSKNGGGNGPGRGGNGQNAPDIGPGRGPGNNPGGGGRGPDAPGPKGQGGGKNDDTGGGKGGSQPTDGANDLSDDLSNSNLSEDEQDNITDALNNNSNSNTNPNNNANDNTNTNNNTNSNVSDTNENLNSNSNDNSNKNGIKS